MIGGNNEWVLSTHTAKELKPLILHFVWFSDLEGKCIISAQFYDSFYWRNRNDIEIIKLMKILWNFVKSLQKHLCTFTKCHGNDK